jgi:hypothetical protein
MNDRVNPATCAQVAMHRNFRCDNRCVRRRARAAETESLETGDDEPHGKSHG